MEAPGSGGRSCLSQNENKLLRRNLSFSSSFLNCKGPKGRARCSWQAGAVPCACHKGLSRGSWLVPEECFGDSAGPSVCRPRSVPRSVQCTDS